MTDEAKPETTAAAVRSKVSYTHVEEDTGVTLTVERDTTYVTVKETVGDGESVLVMKEPSARVLIEMLTSALEEEVG